MASSAGRKGGSLNWKEKSASRRWRSIFSKGCLQRIEEQRMLQASTGNPPSTGMSKKK